MTGRPQAVADDMIVSYMESICETIEGAAGNSRQLNRMRPYMISSSVLSTICLEVH